jgi:hypothetical protein
MIRCRYHEDYGGGRWRLLFWRDEMATPPREQRPSCQRQSKWMLSVGETGELKIPICVLHRRAIDARMPRFKNKNGRWTLIESEVA